MPNISVQPMNIWTSTSTKNAPARVGMRAMGSSRATASPVVNSAMSPSILPRAGVGGNRMDVDAYSYAHRGAWNRLDFLARKGTLTGAEADELVALYRRTSQQLARLQTHSPDPELVAGLSAVLARARAKVLGTRADTWSEIGRFFTHRFPAAVYRAWPWWAAVAAGFLLVTAGIAGWVSESDSARSVLGIPRNP